MSSLARSSPALMELLLYNQELQLVFEGNGSTRRLELKEQTRVLVGLATILQAVNEQLNGPQWEVTAELKSTSLGSYIMTLELALRRKGKSKKRPPLLVDQSEKAAPTSTMLERVLAGTAAVITIIAGLHPLYSPEKKQEGDRYQITNNYYIGVDKEAAELAKRPEIRRAASKVVSPLRTKDFHTFFPRRSATESVPSESKVHKENLPAFETPSRPQQPAIPRESSGLLRLPQQRAAARQRQVTAGSSLQASPSSTGRLISDFTRRVVCDLITASFHDPRAWVLKDGQTFYTAEIQDKGFWENIENGNVRLGADDKMDVELRERVYEEADGSRHSAVTVTAVFSLL